MEKTNIKLNQCYLSINSQFSIKNFNLTSVKNHVVI